MRGFLLPTIILTIFGGLFGVTKATDAQDLDLTEIMISLDADQVPIKKALNEIEEQTNLSFAFSYSAIKTDRKVSVKAYDKSVEEILKHMFKERWVSWGLSGNTILLKKWIKPTQEVPVSVIDDPIEGQVRDAETGETLPGVNILVKGTSTGVSTDQNGNFELRVPSLQDTLVVSFIGYQTIEVPISGQIEIDILLEQDTSIMDEVIVVGFDTKDRASITSAVSSLEMDDILGDRPMSDASKVLQGAVPGLQVTYGSGQPGTDAALNIRGFESINGGEPLVLVNNVPMDIEDVNPRDIEEVTVLKDAAASAIYGARAAFGVILITTQKGDFNQPLQFDYSTTLGFSRPANVSRKASMLENIQAFEDWGQTKYYMGHDLETWRGFLLDYQNNPSNYSGGYIDHTDGYRYWLKETDVYRDLMSERGFEQIQNFSFSGGSQSSSYRGSFGYTDENGAIVTDKDRFRRYNGNVTLTSKLTPKLTTSLDFKYSNSFKSDPFMGDYYPLFYRAIQANQVYPLGSYEAESGELIPYATAANQVRNTPARKNYGQNIRLSGLATYNVLDNIELNAEYTFERKGSNTETTNYLPTLMGGDNMKLEPFIPSSTSYTLADRQRNYNALNLYGKYREEFGSHKFSLLLGINQEASVSKGFSASRSVLISPDAPGLSTSSGTQSTNDTYTEFKVIGFFGRLKYNFKDKYLLEVNSRYDGSSRFPQDNRFGFFPSVSAGWNVASEPFMRRVHVLSHLKLRGSWGNIGNQNISNYAYYSTMSPVNVAWIHNSTGQRAISFNSPELVRNNFTWETVQTLNLGADIGFWDDRLYITFDWYNRKTLDMLAPGSELPAVLGASAPLQNVADLETKGWELDVRWRDQIGDFNYNIGFNLYDHQTKILNFDNEAGLISQYYVGRQIGEIWGYTTDRFYMVDDFVSGTLDENLMGGTLKEGIPTYIGTSPNPGDIKYADLNGDGEISPGASTLADPGDRTIIGNNTRRYQFGLRGSATYKNVDISFLIQGVGKRDLWIHNSVSFPYINQYFPIYKNQLDYWTPNNPDAYYPRIYPYAGGNYGTSRQVQKKYLRNGAYLRLKNITIGYTLPQVLLNRVGINDMRIFFSGENFLTIDYLPQELNAELNNLGEGAYYPFLRKITVGLNVSF